MDRANENNTNTWTVMKFKSLAEQKKIKFHKIYGGLMLVLYTVVKQSNKQIRFKIVWRRRKQSHKNYICLNLRNCRSLMKWLLTQVREDQKMKKKSKNERKVLVKILILKSKKRWSNLVSTVLIAHSVQTITQFPGRVGANRALMSTSSLEISFTRVLIV